MNFKDFITRPTLPVLSSYPGLEVGLHVTTWPLFPLILLSAIVLRGPGIITCAAAVVCTTFTYCFAAGLHALMILWFTPRSYRKAYILLLFPFGPVLVDRAGTVQPAGGPRSALIAPLACLLGGAMIQLAHPTAASPLGQVLLSYGLFLLTPCYPLPGALIHRSLLRRAGWTPTAVDRRSIEVVRLASCILAILAILAGSLPLLYAVAVLWVFAHMALAPHATLDSVKADSLAWFRARWQTLRSQLRRNSKGSCLLTFGAVVCLTISPCQAAPASPAVGGTTTKTTVSHPAAPPRQPTLPAGPGSPPTRVHRVDSPRIPDPATGAPARPSGIASAGVCVAWIVAVGVGGFLALRLRRSWRRCLAVRTQPAAMPPPLTPDRQAEFSDGTEIPSPWLDLPAPRPPQDGAQPCGPPPSVAPLPAPLILDEPVVCKPLSAAMKRTAPAPDQALARLLGAAQLNKSLRLQPLRAAPAPWNLGWGTIKGPVRSRNEDYVLAFESGENRIIVLADGVGGEPFGGRASSMACQIAARHALLKLGASWRGTEPNPEVVALCALLQAEEGLGRIASACRCPTGFKTTLIVVVATPAAYGFAHVGDGRGCVLRETGSLEHFVLAQRGENDGPHVISACLGPNLLGSPRHGLLPRASGDLLVVGSDGVFSECVQWEVDLALNLRQAALQCRGHLQLTVDLTLSELSQARDEHGYLFDDNLSLVILGTGQAPQSPSRAPVLPTEGIPHAEVPDPVTNSPWPSSAPDQVGQERTSAIS